MKQPSKSLTIPGSEEWKSTRWNIGEAAVNKKHHNWHKIFGDKKPTLKEIDPYVKEALMKGQWIEVQPIMTSGKKGIVTGTKMKLVHQVGEHKIWLLGKKTLDGELIINNAGVE